MLLPLLKQIPDPRGSDAYKHLYEIRSANAEEWHSGFSGYRLRKQGLSCPGRADDQHTLRYAPTKLLKFTRIFQELNDFKNFLFCLINASDV